MDNWAPLAGFSIALCLLLGALGTFSLLLWLTVPFSLFSIRTQLKQQVEILRRIEGLLGNQPSQEQASSPTPQDQPPVELPRPM